MSPVAEQVNGFVATLAALAVILPIVVWVYVDASDRERDGRPVVARIGSLDVTTAKQWLAGSIALMILFVPLYVAARKAQP